jgi:hypothetical protein
VPSVRWFGGDGARAREAVVDPVSSGDIDRDMEEEKTSVSFLPENPERRLENDRVRWPVLEAGDGATGDGGSGVVWGEDTDDDCGASEKGVEAGQNPKIGSAGEDLLNDVDLLCAMGDAGMDKEEAETVCVDFDLGAVPPDEER